MPTNPGSGRLEGFIASGQYVPPLLRNIIPSEMPDRAMRERKKETPGPMTGPGAQPNRNDIDDRVYLYPPA